MSIQDILTNDIFNLVVDKCNINSINLLKNTSLKINEIIDKSIISKKIKEYFPIYLHKFINFNKFIIIAVNLDLGNKIGFTGYIDFITKKNFINDNYKTNILFGYDSTNRFFISILYDVFSLDLKNKIKENNIVTYFQRYSDYKYGYVSCQNTLIYESYVQTHNFQYDDNLGDQYKVLFDLLNNGSSVKDNKTYCLSNI
jgi:hypothetical protein